ncbi:MAG TPA: class I SAM-dependent methyltransferase [Ignavibacteria bacterium]|nr:class I SAM-dependent methyltransferase [Ignavibacteria bacterium]HRA99085.1 class I SAM-dependent methyltransferase [Ignavibacteria bacterium]
MPSEIQNLEKWDKDYDWSQSGDEWSEAWGGTNSLWWWMLYPRLRKFLKVNRILEIAPGYGRITQFLKDQCNELVIVDISGNCIEACKNRFRDSKNIEFHVNNGTSLDFVKDNSIDFVFSFDSLVHAENNILQKYITEINKKLVVNGNGFLHHSNLGGYKKLGKYFFNFLPPARIRTHWRAETMTAKLFNEYCTAENLNCNSQELINWGGKYLIDSFSVFSKNSQNNKNQIIENYEFMKEADYIKKISELYLK